MKLFSWGSNSHGQLGQGNSEEQQTLPKLIDFNIKPLYIGGGGKHSIILSDFEIYTCGDNDKGQLGKDLSVTSTIIFKPLHCPYKVVKVACGWDFNLALTDTGDVLGWGSNSFGQLGLQVQKVPYLSSPTKIFEKAIAIAGGLRHSAIVTLEGFVYTSGFGRKGQLGVIINKVVPSKVEEFSKVNTLKDILDISCGECHCLAVTSTAQLFSWGNNKHGQLGISPETSSAYTPIQINIPSKTKKISLFSGWAHNLVLTGEGKLISWGRNDFGQLSEPRKYHWKPQEIENMNKIKQVCVGSHHSVVLTESGDVFTWGWNEHGNCGDGACENVFKPYKLEGCTKVKAIGSGAAHSFLYL